LVEKSAVKKFYTLYKTKAVEALCFQS